MVSTRHGELMKSVAARFDGVNIGQVYFKEQSHSSLPSFVQNELDSWGDDIGAQAVVMTYSPFSHDAVDILRGALEGKSNGQEMENGEGNQENGGGNQDNGEGNQENRGEKRHKLKKQRQNRVC